MASARLPWCVLGSKRATFPDARCAAASSVDPRFEVDSHAWCSSSVAYPLRGRKPPRRARHHPRSGVDGCIPAACWLSAASPPSRRKPPPQSRQQWRGRVLCIPPRIVPPPRARRRRHGEVDIILVESSPWRAPPPRVSCSSAARAAFCGPPSDPGSPRLSAAS